MLTYIEVSDYNPIVFSPTVLNINIISLIEKLLVLIKPSFTLFTNYLTEPKKLMFELVSMYVWNKIYETSFADSETFIF